MDTLVMSDLSDWRTIRTRYQYLMSVDLISEGVSDWLTQWSELEKAILETWTFLKQPAYRDKTDHEAVVAYEGFTREMFSTYKGLTEGLAQKWLSISDSGSDVRAANLRRRMQSEADLFRAENMPLHAHIIDLVNAYGQMPRPAGPTPDDYSSRWLYEREAVNDLFLKILSLRRQLAHNAGLHDYRAYHWRELNRLDYSPELCVALNRAIETDVVPVVSELRDTLDSLQSPHFEDASVLEDVVEAVLGGVDPQIGTLFSSLRDGYLDLGPRSGKRDGDEEWFFPLTGLPYLHINSLDLFTVIHECGHGLHDFLSLHQQKLFWYISGPEEFQEFAALTLQTLAYSCLSKADGGPLSPDDARAARDANLWLCLHALPRLARDDAFQHWIYAEASEDVMAEDLDSCWLDLTRRFLPHEATVGNETEVSTGWQRWNWSLISQPFYMVNYLGGVLGAWQVWRHALTDQAAALHAYKTALALGNTQPLPNLYRAAGACWLPNAEIMSELVAFVAAHLRAGALGNSVQTGKAS